MPTFNFVFLKGNLTAKPELSYTSTGTPVAKATLAVNEKFKNAKKELVERVGFFDLVIWNKLGEVCTENLVKGQEVIVDGRLRFEKWQDQEGATHSKVRIIVSSIYFGHKPKDKSQPNEPLPPSVQGTPPPELAENQEEPAEDIPF
jgi:single-strand DNA-binding protein